MTRAHLLGVLAVTLATGCGPGLSHRAKAPDDVLNTLNSELENSIGTTSLTSAELSRRPPSRFAPLMVAEWDGEGAEPAAPEVAAAPLQTWSTPTDEVRSIEPASMPLDLHPYDP